jgi:hypothetical protein
MISGPWRAFTNRFDRGRPFTGDPPMPGVRAARGALPPGARRIGRQALARFVVEALDTDEWNLCWGVGQ